MTQSFEEICQSRLALMPWLAPRTSRLPGINPLAWSDWLLRDDAFARQMAYRDHLLNTRRSAVFSANDLALEPANELLSLMLRQLATDSGYQIDGDQVTRPDGVCLNIKADHPLLTSGRLTQQDQCILLPEDHGSMLRAAVLCFPASWTLSEKMDRDMFAIHQPVQEYTADMGRRVARMFDRIQPECPLWRANNLIYSKPDLFQPRRESQGRQVQNGRKWVRVERQSLIRLPRSKAIVFGIHTTVVPFESLSGEQGRALVAYLADH